jgi:hypothetical protein
MNSPPQQRPLTPTAIDRVQTAYSREARKEIGLGQPPDAFGGNCDTMLASQCAPQGRIEIAEVAQWRVDLPVADTSIPTTFGNRIDVWGTPDNQPPAGVTNSSNTLASPTMFAADMIIRGIRVRLLVEPEARTVMGNFVDIANNLPGSPDAWTINDLNHSLGLATLDGVRTQDMIPSEFLWGIPTWKAAYAFWQGYELAVTKDNQDALIKEPLTQVGTIQPFAEAEAAGLAFASNQDRVLVLNDRLIALGIPQQFVGEYFKRLGALTVGGLDVGDFTVSREADASSAMFGGIGVPTPWANNREPYLFNTPMFWPAGHPMGIRLNAVNTTYQSDFQRWLSVTGGSGGLAGQDLNLPFSHSPGMSGIMPSGAPTTFMLEQTLDVAPAVVVNVPQQTQTNRAILKGGTMLFEIGVIGWRCSNPKWGPVIARAIASGAMLAPRGYGSLTTYLQNLTG